jgi:hypothetical protein
MRKNQGGKEASGPNPDMNFQFDHIIRILRSGEIATTSFNIRGSEEKHDLGTRKENKPSIYI